MKRSVRGNFHAPSAEFLATVPVQCRSARSLSVRRRRAFRWIDAQPFLPGRFLDPQSPSMT